MATMLGIVALDPNGDVHGVYVNMTEEEVIESIKAESEKNADFIDEFDLTEEVTVYIKEEGTYFDADTLTWRKK